MDFSIRSMTKEDITLVQHVASVSWQSTYDGVIPIEIQERFLTHAYSETMMDKRMEHSIVLVAELSDTIVGFANFTHVDEKGMSELAAIYLSPESQGKGIGTALLTCGIDCLRGVKRIAVTVEKENERGKRFYTSKGFHELHEFEEDFDGHLLQSIRMELIITDANRPQGIGVVV